MKKSALLLFAALFLARTAAANEAILSFHSTVAIASNAELTVTETIRVHAEGWSIKHGIYRDFPQLYRGKWGLRQGVGFAVQHVVRDGHPEPWRVERRENGQRVYIGDAGVLVDPGDHIYELVYTTDRQLGFFDDHDELYWNVTGNGWEFPIEIASAEVQLPAGATILSREAYTGPFGAKGRDYRTELIASNVARFATTRTMNPREGLTIVVTWPKGLVQPAVRPDDFLVRVRDNPGLALGVAGLFAVFIYYITAWMLFGRDPAKGTIIPLYGPPEGFSPAAVRVMSRMNYDTKAFAANVIQLAVRGTLVLKEIGKEYRVECTGKAPGDLQRDEKTLLEALFRRNDALAFNQAFHERISGAEQVLRTSVLAKLERTYFVKNTGFWSVGLLFSLVPLAVSLVDATNVAAAMFITFWLALWSLGVTGLVSSAVSQFRAGNYGSGVFLALFSIPFLGGELAGLFMLVRATSYWVAGLFVVGVLMNGIFYHLLKAPTRLGRAALDRIEGFRRYLAVAEKDRLNFENPPARTPELFDRFLPYALALDVEQEWAEQFSDILGGVSVDGRTGYAPTWYYGGHLATGSLVAFTTDVGSSLSSAISSSAQAPGSSSGSSSFGGGGGGGSSGGGGGGGGGGGW